MSLMPVSFTLTIIGSFAMAGLPPFNGFLSKEMFFTSVLTAFESPVFGMKSLGLLFPIIAWVASVFTFIYCMILVFKTFMGKYRPERLDKEAHEAPIGMLVSPIILGILVIGIFFFPNVVSDYLLQPALIAVLPEFSAAGGIDVKITPWHGWSTELFMTMGVVGLGVLMYRNLKKWSPLYGYFPQSLTLNGIYNHSLAGLESISLKLTKQYMTGFVRDYLVYIFAFMIFLRGWSLWFSKDLSFALSNNAPIHLYAGGVICGMLIAALTVLFSKSRFTAIIAVGALGYLVSLFFVIFRAPDLALTQLVVETVTAALFLLCFYHLPELRKERSGIPFKLTNLLVSLGVGTVVTMIALSANNHRLFESISGYFEDSYTLAGAKNIVNAILVDFRGLDTMLEILVLCIAGLGVYTLIRLQLDGREKK